MASESNRFADASFSYSEMLWITLALSLAKVQSAHGDDRELESLVREAAAAVNLVRREG